jgi:hypothetical protein
VTVRELRAALLLFPADLPVGILYDTQMGFYPAHEVKLSQAERQFQPDGGVTEGVAYVCVCDAP